MKRLTSGAYAAVHEVRPWRIFQSIDGSPGVTLDQIAESAGVDTTIARALRKPMTENKVVIVKAGGHYLDVSGRGLLASSQRVTAARAHRRGGFIQGGEGSTAAPSVFTTEDRHKPSVYCGGTALLRIPPWAW